MSLVPYVIPDFLLVSLCCPRCFSHAVWPRACTWVLPGRLRCGWQSRAGVVGGGLKGGRRTRRLRARIPDRLEMGVGPMEIGGTALFLDQSGLIPFAQLGPDLVYPLGFWAPRSRA